MLSIVRSAARSAAAVYHGVPAFFALALRLLLSMATPVEWARVFAAARAGVPLALVAGFVLRLTNPLVAAQANPLGGRRTGRLYRLLRSHR